MSDIHFRESKCKHLGAKRRQKLLSSLTNGYETMFVVNNFCPLEEYYKISTRLCREFQSSLQKSTKSQNLDNSFVLGCRYVKYISTVFSKHIDFPNENTSALNKKVERTLKEVQEEIMFLAHRIDEDEMNKLILQDLLQRGSNEEDDQDKDSHSRQRNVRQGRHERQDGDKTKRMSRSLSVLPSRTNSTTSRRDRQRSVSRTRRSSSINPSQRQLVSKHTNSMPRSRDELKISPSKDSSFSTPKKNDDDKENNYGFIVLSKARSSFSTVKRNEKDLKEINMRHSKSDLHTGSIKRHARKIDTSSPRAPFDLQDPNFDQNESASWNPSSGNRFPSQDTKKHLFTTSPDKSDDGSRRSNRQILNVSSLTMETFETGAETVSMSNTKSTVTKSVNLTSNGSKKSKSPLNATHNPSNLPPSWIPSIFKNKTLMSPFRRSNRKYSELS